MLESINSYCIRSSKLICVIVWMIQSRPGQIEGVYIHHEWPKYTASVFVDQLRSPQYEQHTSYPCSSIHIKAHTHTYLYLSTQHGIQILGAKPKQKARRVSQHINIIGLDHQYATQTDRCHEQRYRQCQLFSHVSTRGQIQSEESC